MGAGWRRISVFRRRETIGFFLGKRAAVREFKRAFNMDRDERITAMAPAYIGSEAELSPQTATLFDWLLRLFWRKAFLFPSFDRLKAFSNEPRNSGSRRGLLFITTKHVVFFAPEVEGKCLIFFTIEDIQGMEVSAKDHSPLVVFYVADAGITRWWLPKGRFAPTSQDVGVSSHRIAKWIVRKVQAVRNIEVWDPLPPRASDKDN